MGALSLKCLRTTALQQPGENIFNSKRADEPAWPYRHQSSTTIKHMRNVIDFNGIIHVVSYMCI